MSTHGRSTRRFKLLARNLRAQRQQCWNYGIDPTCKGIDYDAPPGDPSSFTVDHVVPLSINPAGAEDPGNLRASCLHCNSARGDDRASTAATIAESASHNYSPMANGVVSSDWNDDWHTNPWHRTHPTTPCPCRPVEQRVERTYRA